MGRDRIRPFLETTGGHINPAVTFGLFVARKVSLVRAVAYMKRHNPLELCLVYTMDSEDTLRHPLRSSQCFFGTFLQLIHLVIKLVELAVSQQNCQESLIVVICSVSISVLLSTRIMQSVAACFQVFCFSCKGYIRAIFIFNKVLIHPKHQNSSHLVSEPIVEV